MSMPSRRQSLNSGNLYFYFVTGISDILLSSYRNSYLTYFPDCQVNTVNCIQ
ncbi:hypothetical protein KSF78_0008211 [Schistosoma japonicum]|nr:hypothetical protein KSF78_0008211 [Schistosoma japonicum]